MNKKKKHYCMVVLQSKSPHLQSIWGFRKVEHYFTPCRNCYTMVKVHRVWPFPRVHLYYKNSLLTFSFQNCDDYILHLKLKLHRHKIGNYDQRVSDWMSFDLACAASTARAKRLPSLVRAHSSMAARRCFAFSGSRLCLTYNRDWAEIAINKGFLSFYLSCW